MIENRLVSTVAVTLGYSSGEDEAARKKRFDAARALIRRIREGESLSDDDGTVACLVSAVSSAVEPFDKMEDGFKKAMSRLAEQLPVAAWCAEENQRGFGILSLATVVGEAGNLSLYANPGKLWKRLGCAPFEKEGTTRMPATWRMKGGLSAEQWTELGYSPRRRSIAYNIGECLLKANKSEYRQRYDEAKSKMAAGHPDDKDYPPARCHKHGMLLMTKRLLRNLWTEWRRFSV